MNRVELLILYKRKFEELFMTKLATKTGWGKNDLAVMFNSCSAEATEYAAIEMEKENNSKKTIELITFPNAINAVSPEAYKENL